MISSFAFATAFCLSHQGPGNDLRVGVMMEPTDDVWVYPHAGDPGGDPFLRVWGTGNNSVAPSNGELENYSYGYLMFNLTGAKPKSKLVAATLELTCANKPVEGIDYGSFPLEVRGLNSSFKEKEFTWDNATTVNPSKELLFGSAIAKPKGDNYVIKIDLMGEKSKFADYVNAAIEAKKPFGFALTSKFDTAEFGMKGVYKVYSKDNKDQKIRPVLTLDFAD